MKVPENRSRWLALLVVFMLVVAACSDDSGDTTTTASETGETTAATEAPKAPITVAAINQQDGVVAWPEMISAANAILDWYNAQGGIDGHPIELNLCTAGDEPESTQSCSQKFANDDAAEFVFPMSIPNSDAMFQVLVAAPKPMIGHLGHSLPRNPATSARAACSEDKRVSTQSPVRVPLCANLSG